ncbi:GDNF family receptor alpha-4 [Bagarius yarrelli]|uniref:GDNF family receptor alpha-4 n=1 Tax=Bagarius yarrelli TaxID=175774 RepID=A0A556VA83_BAGYA|nr:GDNF family receptor alpha-4 [Bagarius yarrelli]
MFRLGILLNLLFIRGLLSSVVPLFPGTLDCVQAVQECMAQAECEKLYRQLDYCVDEEAVAPLGHEARQACTDAQNALLHHRPLQECKCQRGSRKEALCLRVYWTVRFPQGYDDIETSPYEDIELELVRNSEVTKLASIVAVSSFPVDGQNQCLKAAQDCGLFEKCGALRAEYVLACTKRVAGSNRCNRQKCHRALRRFLERVPEELADFQQNCQPSSYSPSGCLRDSGAVCLKAYAGLIGTIMTPNYVSNSSMEVSQWCNCEGSGNQLQECLRILHMFNSNTCLRNAIENMGSSNPRPVEGTLLPPPRPSPHILQEEIHVNMFEDLNSMAKKKVQNVFINENCTCEELCKAGNVLLAYNASDLGLMHWKWQLPRMLLSVSKVNCTKPDTTGHSHQSLRQTLDKIEICAKRAFAGNYTTTNVNNKNN